MSLVCKETRGYALTEKKSYDLLQKKDGYVYVLNDNGNRAKYSAKMFDEDNGAVAQQVVPRTEQDCINSIVINGDIIKYNRIDNEEYLIDLTEYIDDEESEISCGIGEVSGINAFIEAIHDVVDEEGAQDDLLSLKKELFKRGILHYVKNLADKRAMYLLSTNINEDEDLVPILNEIAHFSSNEVINPNSDNTIKMWGFYESQL